MSNYPLGAANDPRAPYNQVEVTSSYDVDVAALYSINGVEREWEGTIGVDITEECYYNHGWLPEPEHSHNDICDAIRQRDIEKNLPQGAILMDWDVIEYRAA